MFQAVQVRPMILKDLDQMDAKDAMRKAKIEVAFGLVGLFVDATKPMYNPNAEDEGYTYFQRDLKPKEEAAYAAALHHLETFLDSPD